MALLGAQWEHGRIKIHFRHVYCITTNIQGFSQDLLECGEPSFFADPVVAYSPLKEVYIKNKMGNNFNK